MISSYTAERDQALLQTRRRQITLCRGPRVTRLQERREDIMARKASTQQEGEQRVIMRREYRSLKMNIIAFNLVMSRKASLFHPSLQTRRQESLRDMLCRSEIRTRETLRTAMLKIKVNH
jgi:hypothetical protein